MKHSKKQLAAATLNALHVAERERFCAFIADEATQFALNPFAVTTVGVVLQRWSTRQIEFRAFGIFEAGLSCLLSSAGTLPETDTLAQEILKAGLHILYLCHDGDGSRVHLTGKEYQMLELLSLRKGTTLTKEMFLNHLYGGMDEPELKIIDVFICKLRKKLANASSGKNYIETVGAEATSCTTVLPPCRLWPTDPLAGTWWLQVAPSVRARARTLEYTDR